MLCFQALALTPGHPGLRSRNAKLLLEVGRFDAALEQADLALEPPAAGHESEGQERDRVALYVRAVASQERARTGAEIELAEIVAVLQEAIDSNRGAEEHIELAIRLASVYRSETREIYRDILPKSDEGEVQHVPVPQAERNRLADECMDEMVEANADRASAFLMRYRYRIAYGLSGTEEDLQAALALEPEDSGAARLASAERALQQGSAADACTVFEQLIQDFPEQRSSYLGLAQSYAVRATQSGDRQLVGQAIAALQKGLANTDPNDFGINAELARLLIHSGRVKEAEDVLNVLDKIVNDQRLFVTPIERMLRRAIVGLRRAESLTAQRVSHRVPGVLRPVVDMELPVTASAGAIARAENVKRSAYSLLGAAYEKLGESDRAVIALEEAVNLAPGRYESRLAAGRANERAQHADLALGHYRAATEMNRADSRSWLGVARVLFQQQLSLAAEDRDWGQIEKALSKADETNSNVFEVKMFAAGVAVAQANREKAIESLQAAEAAPPISMSDWGRLISAYEGLAEPDRADRVLKSCSGVPANALGALLLWADLISRRGRWEDAERKLLSTLSSLRGDDRAGILSYLAEREWRQKQLDSAKTHLEELVQIREGNILAIERLCSIALAEARFEDAQKWEARLHELEGPTGTRWRVYMAQRLIFQSEDSQDEKLIEAERLQLDIEGMRPNWAVAYRLKGMLAERRGQVEEAVRAIERAVELDASAASRERDVVRIAQMLYPRGQDAEDPLGDRELPAVVAMSRPGSTWVISQSVARGNIPQAVQDARIAVRHRPGDPAAHTWLGHTLLLAGELDESEASFLRATDLAPNSLQARNELLSFYEQTKNTDKGVKLLEKLARNKELAEPQRSLLLAQGYAMFNDRATAESHFLRLLEEHPDDAEVVYRAGQFLSSTNAELAEQLFRKARKLQPDDRRSRLALATLLANRGDDAGFDEARLLLSGGTAESPSSVEARRLHAQLLIRRGDEANRLAAMKILEELVQNARVPSFRDRLALAAVYEAGGQIKPAKEQLAALAARTTASPQWLAGYAEFLLRHKADADSQFASLAEETIKQLEQVQPNSTLVLRLRLRWLSELGREDEIEQTVKAFLENSLEKMTDGHQQSLLLMSVATVCAAENRNDQAEGLFRRAADLNPDTRLSLAAFLAGRQTEEKTLEAVKMCAAAAESGEDSRALQAMCSVLTNGAPSVEATELAEPIISAALERYHQDQDLLSIAGSLRLMQGRLDEAGDLLHRAIKLSSSNVAAMNNLAYLLALDGNPDEALEYANRAIAIAGRSPSLVDTLGVVYYYQQKYDEAIAIFEELSGQPNVDPRTLFHLALSHQSAGNTAMAKSALARSRAAGLTPVMLVPQERPLLADMDASLTSEPTR